MRKKTYDELAFSDDFMFCNILQNNEDLCKELLELILGKKIAKISYPEKSYVIFICIFDYFGKGLHKYSFENACHEVPKLVSLELTCRKLRKNYSVEEIADALEEEEQNIRKIYNVVVKYAPEYDVDQIYEELIEKLNL